MAIHGREVSGDTQSSGTAGMNGGKRQKCTIAKEGSLSKGISPKFRVKYSSYLVNQTGHEKDEQNTGVHVVLGKAA